MALKLPFMAIPLLAIGLAPCLFAEQAPSEFAKLDVHLAVAKSHAVAESQVPLLIHFHGAPRVVEQNFHASGLGGVLVVVNCRGLSSAYRRPFENPALLGYLVDHVEQQLVTRGQLKAGTTWQRIDLSSFSAGYGAVREVLKRSEQVSRVRAVVAADSMYASIAKQRNQRLVNSQQMKSFADFAQLAADGKKMFVVSYSELPVEAYASTSETAHYLMEQVGINERPVEPRSGDSEFTPHRLAAKEGLVLLGYAGADGEAHLSHLRNIASLWKLLEQHRAGTLDKAVKDFKTEPQDD